MVVLSAAVGSVPSLIAFRKEYGVTSFRPSACASGAKMLSDAPTGMPPNRRLIVAIKLLYCARPCVSNADSCRLEVAGVLRVELRVVVHDRRDHLLHVRRRVPAVRVAAVGLDADELPDVEHDAAAQRAGGDEPRRPRVVADPVLDHHPGAGDRAGVDGGGLVVVRVGRRVRDDARDVDAVAAELGGDAAPEVLGGDDLERAAGGLGAGGRGGDEGREEHGNGEQVSAHGS